MIDQRNSGDNSDSSDDSFSSTLTRPGGATRVDTSDRPSCVFTFANPRSGMRDPIAGGDCETVEMSLLGHSLEGEDGESALSTNMRRLRQAVSDNPTWDDILNSEAKAREDTGKVTREQAETDAIHRAIGIFGSYFRVDIPKDASLTVKQGKIVSQISPHETKVNTWQLSIASGRGIKSLPAFVPDPNDKPYEVLGIKLEDGSLELYFGTRQFAALGSDLLHTVHEVVRDRDSRWSDTILRIMQTQREGLSWAGRKYSDSLIVTGSGETIEISPAYSPEDCEPRIMYKAVVSKV